MHDAEGPITTRTASLVLAAASLLVLASCSRPLPEGVYECETRAKCPPSWFCRADEHCWSTPDEAGTGADSGDASGSFDASGDGGSSVRIDVVARRALVPVEGATVIFHDSDGEVVDVAETDASGRASTSVPTASIVTISDPSQQDDTTGDARLFTVFDLAAPTTVTFDLIDADDVVFRSVAIPGPFTDATEYAVDGACGGNANTDPSASFNACDTPGETNVIAFAYGIGQPPLAYAALLRGKESSDVVFDEWHTDFATNSIEVLGADSAGDITARALLRLGNGDIPLGISEGRTSEMRLIPGISGHEIAVYGRGVEAIADGMVTRSRSHTFSSGLPTTVSIDLALSPVVQSYSAERADPAHPSISWTSTSTVDFASAFVRYRPRGLIQWSLVGPSTAGQLRLPSLPDARADWRPTPEVPDWSLSLAHGEPAFTCAEIVAHALAADARDLATATMSGSF